MNSSDNETVPKKTFRMYISNLKSWGDKHKKIVISSLWVLSVFGSFFVGLVVSDGSIYLNHNLAGERFGMVHLKDYEITKLEKTFDVNYFYPENRTYSIYIENNWLSELRTEIEIDTEPDEQGFEFLCKYPESDGFGRCNDDFLVEKNEEVIINFSVNHANSPKYKLCVKVMEFNNHNNYDKSCIDIFVREK